MLAGVSRCLNQMTVSRGEVDELIKAAIDNGQLQRGLLLRQAL